MPSAIQNLIPQTQRLVTIAESESGELALSLMLEHDFSQLPVVSNSHTLEGMITSDSILRAASFFRISPVELKVSHAVTKTKTCRIDDELSDLLSGLQDNNAMPIVDKHNMPKAIITSYDTAEYFRYRAEDIMLAEDIEMALRDRIITSHQDETGEIDEYALNQSIQAIVPSNRQQRNKFKRALCSYINQVNNEQRHALNNEIADSVFAQDLEQSAHSKPFHKLTLGEFIQIFRQCWPEHQENFNDISQGAMFRLLDSARDTRNDIAHFRAVTPQKRDQLRFCASFLEQHRPVDLIELESLKNRKGISQNLEDRPLTDVNANVPNNIGSAPIDEEIDENDSRYAPLAVWLQSQNSNKLACTFSEIEAIIADELPSSAHRHRSWWGNDGVGSSQSIQWLEAGWRVSNVNISARRVVFSQISDRQGKYIHFFSQLQEKLQHVEPLIITPRTNPQGRNWFTISAQSKKDESDGSFWLSFSFTHRARFRIEFYIDEPKIEDSKLIFNLLYEQKKEIETNLGFSLSWERLDKKRASRVACYRADSSITNSEKALLQIQDWAIVILPKFYDALFPKVRAAYRQVKQQKQDGLD